MPHCTCARTDMQLEQFQNLRTRYVDIKSDIQLPVGSRAAVYIEAALN